MAERLGRYIAERVLGSGAFATVWLARDETLDTNVAIKVLAENWARDADTRERFVNEARVLRNAESDYVVRILDIDELPDGRPYIVMDYADRGSLASRMEARTVGGQALSIDEAVALVHNVGAGLDVVHRLGVVHRDLKPENIMFRTIPEHRRSDRDEQLVLVDFGLARGAQRSGATIATGTPHYMAPEQASGQASVRSDIFSLTVILYELLAGRLPFPHRSLGEILSAQMSNTFEPLERIRGDIPPALSAFIAQNLSADPAARSASISDWIRDLYQAARGAPATQATVAGAAAAPTSPTVSVPSGAPPDPGRTLAPSQLAAAMAARPAPPPAGVAVAATAPPLPPDNRRRRGGVVWLGAGLVAALAAGIGGVVVLTGGDEPDGSGASEVFLEPVSSLGDDPFTADIVFPTVRLGELADDVREGARGVLEGLDVELGELPEIDFPDIDLASLQLPGSGDGDGLDGDGSAVATISGGTPGLYGGTNLLSVCDRAQLTAFLLENVDKARAWAGVLNIATDQITQYIDGLTEVILQVDTRVTNHGFVNGAANAINSVLQAGTAVLVDRFGVPRVRCKCGNPLRPPQPLSVDVEVRGTPWPGFDLDLTVVVAATDPVVEFTLDDLTSDQAIIRAPGDATGGTTTTTAPVTTTTADLGLGSGDVQVTLLWDGNSDLDLHVRDPDGFELSFTAPSAPSGGQLDRDDGSSCAGDGPKVENVFWPLGGAPPGSYEAWAFGYSMCGGTSEEFTLEVRVGGELVQTLNGVLTENAESERVTFTAAGGGGETSGGATDITSSGAVQASSVTEGFEAALAIDADVTTSWFSLGPAVDASGSSLTWTTGGASVFVDHVTIVGNGANDDPRGDFRTGFGFATVDVFVLTSNDAQPVLVGSSALDGTPDPTVDIPVGTDAQSVLVVFSGHESVDCGGIAELQIVGAV